MYKLRYTFIHSSLFPSKQYINNIKSNQKSYGGVGLEAVRPVNSLPLKCIQQRRGTIWKPVGPVNSLPQEEGQFTPLRKEKKLTTTQYKTAQGRAQKYIH